MACAIKSNVSVSLNTFLLARYPHGIPKSSCDATGSMTRDRSASGTFHYIPLTCVWVYSNETADGLEEEVKDGRGGANADT